MAISSGVSPDPVFGQESICLFIISSAADMLKSDLMIYKKKWRFADYTFKTGINFHMYINIFDVVCTKYFGDEINSYIYFTKLIWNKEYWVWRTIMIKESRSSNLGYPTT